MLKLTQWNPANRTGVLPTTLSGTVPGMGPKMSRWWTVSLGLSLVCALNGACDGGTAPAEPEAVVSVFEAVNPTGTVTGQVVDALTGTPLQGATVTLIATNETTTSDATGGFRFETVPASSAIALQVDFAGYASALDTVTIPSSAGNLPQNNGVAFSGPIGLLATSAGESGIRPQLLVRTQGTPSIDVVVESRLNVGFYIAGEARGQLPGTTAQEGEGFFLDGFPDFRVLAAAAPDARLRISVTPVDGTAYRPQVLDLGVGEVLARGTIVVDLDPTVEPPVGEPPYLEGDQVKIVASNLVDLVDDGALLPSVVVLTTGISVEFNRPILPGTFYADAIDGEGAAVGTTITTTDDISFQIAFVGGQVAGSAVLLVLDAIADAPATEGVGPFHAEGTFFVDDPAPLSITRAYYANANNLDVLACPNNLNNTRLVIDLSSSVGARVLDGTGAAVGAPLNRLLPVGAFSNNNVNQALLDTPDGNPALATLTSRAGSATGFYNRLVISGQSFLNAPPTNANTADAVDFRIFFNDLTVADALGGGDVVVRRPNGVPVRELSGVVAVEKQGCP